MNRVDYDLPGITAQKVKFSVKDFFSKGDQILRILRKSLTENFIFCVVNSFKLEIFLIKRNSSCEKDGILFLWKNCLN